MPGECSPGFVSHTLGALPQLGNKENLQSEANAEIMLPGFVTRSPR